MRFTASLSCVFFCRLTVARLLFIGVVNADTVEEDSATADRNAEDINFILLLLFLYYYFAIILQCAQLMHKKGLCKFLLQLVS